MIPPPKLFAGVCRCCFRHGTFVNVLNFRVEDVQKIWGSWWPPYDHFWLVVKRDQYLVRLSDQDRPRRPSFSCHYHTSLSLSYNPPLSLLSYICPAAVTRTCPLIPFHLHLSLPFCHFFVSLVCFPPHLCSYSTPSIPLSRKSSHGVCMISITVVGSH